MFIVLGSPAMVSVRKVVTYPLDQTMADDQPARSSDIVERQARYYGGGIRPDAPDEDNLEQDFYALAEQWRNETSHLSMSSERAKHFAYQQIIGMGKEVLPLIFREL